AVGPRQREKGPGVPGEGAGAERDPAQRDGDRGAGVRGVMADEMSGILGPSYREGRVMTATALEPIVQRPPKPFQFTREIYNRMAEAGDFDDKRVELLDGEILEMPPQSNRHAWLIKAAVKALEAKLGPNYWVRVQMPIDLSP